MCIIACMGHKTLTVSEEAYNALTELKLERESFTEVILRLTRKKRQGDLLEYVRSLEPDPEFASILDGVVKERETIQLNSPEME